MRRSLLQRSKINPLLTPVQQPRILVKTSAHHLRRATRHRHHRDLLVRIEKILHPIRRRKRHLTPIRGEVRIAVRPRRRHQLRHLLIRDRDDVHRRRPAVLQLAILRGGKCNLRPIFRPRKPLHAEPVAFCKPMRLRHAKRRDRSR